MKNIVITIFLLFINAACFSISGVAKTACVDEYFDSYLSDIPWAEQRHRLDHLAVALSREPEYIGHVAFESGKKESFKKAKARMNRSFKHLTQFRKTEKTRLVFIYLGASANPKIILQPVPKGRPSPFSTQYYERSEVVEF